MHLNFLHIDKYKNIQNRDFDFSKNTGYIALIGENGSGKSNLLEAISIIFSCLYNGQNAPFNYKIVYDLAGQSQIVESKDGKIISDKAQYPSSVIACYSGIRLMRVIICNISTKPLVISYIYHPCYISTNIVGK